jgi:hypothetical protein
MAVNTLATAPVETVVFKTTTAGVDPSDHQVFVYKQQTSTGFTGTKYLFNSLNISYTTDRNYLQVYSKAGWEYFYIDSGSPLPQKTTPDQFKGMAAIPRNQEITIHYNWQLQAVSYINGVKQSGINGVYLGQYGYFLVDEYSGANYVDLDLIEGVGAGYKFKVGNRTSPYYAYDDGTTPWPFKTGIAFSATDTKTGVSVATGLPWPLPSTVTKQMNTGSPVIGTSPLTNQTNPGNPLLGKTVEGLPQHYIPVYGVGVTTDVPVYGLQFDLWVK